MSDNDIVQDFLVESYENLDRLDRDLVGLEQNPDDQQALAGVFRTIHTIKGNCGFLGFNKLEKLAHVGENLLARLRDRQLKLSPEITTALLSMVDAVREMLKEIASTGQDGDRDYAELRDRLTRLQTPTPEPSAEQKPASAASEAAPSKVEAKADVPGKKNEGHRKPSRGKIGGVLVERRIVRPTDIARALEEQEHGDRRRLGEILVALGLARSEDILAAQQLIESKLQETAPETVRVGVNLLDKLMTLVGELVLARNQLLQIAGSAESAALHAVSQRMDLIATELQEQVMKTRMQPIGNIWAQFPRTVRDVALSCGKQVSIEMEGKETELDKTIVEAIKDPLTHLVRNSVDHGIESPEERAQAGKDATGKLTLRAFHEGGQVNIEISDDGAGLNLERIRRKAMERGLVTAEHAERMADKEVSNLIFLPGFSTASKITNVSGRGVGMDVVKTNVEKIGGTVDVQSIQGQGTTVRVKIPLTLAIIPALVVTCNQERYAIPQVNLLELVRLELDHARSAIEMVHGTPVYRLRGRLLPLVYLSRELQLAGVGKDESSAPEAVNIVVLQAGDRQFGLVVDQINDTEEIVVKPLRKQLKTVKTFAGSSIMGDGRVALILDVLGLAQRASLLTEGGEHAAAEASLASQDASGQKQTFLLFTGLGDSRMAIPLEALARLEEFLSSQVEVSGNQWVIQYRGQILPLVRLNLVMDERRRKLRGLRGAAAPEEGALQVLVLNHEGRSFGLVVDRIIDIVEDRADIKAAATRASVLYSTVIGERVTELLDIPAIAASIEGIPLASLASAAGAASYGG